MLREYGWQRRYISDHVGRNSRLDELQAAILRIKLRHLDADNGRRQQLAAQYSGPLAGQGLQIPPTREGAEHVFHLYVIRTRKRSELIDYLNKNDIQTGVHYPLPVHLQPAYAGRIRTAGDMSITERLAEEVLSLLIYPELPSTAVLQVTDALISHCRSRSRAHDN
jgi:dTDP-4-amino-4,6-dideoxygalactose transaminase